MALTNDLIRQLELAPRYVLAAPLVESRRVLDLGGGSVHGLVSLAEAGAAALVVVAADPEALRAELQSVGLEGVQVLGESADLGSYDEHGPFDIIICHDLAARLKAHADTPLRLRALLSADGYLVTAVANPQGHFLSELAGTRHTSPMSYEDLVDRLADTFGTPSVFGQSPVTGSLFFDLADGDEETGLSLDRALLPDEDEQGGWYVLFFGPEPYRRDDLAIVQLPFGRIVEGVAHVTHDSRDSVGKQDAAPQHGLEERVALLEAERNGLRVELQTAHSALSMVTQMGTGSGEGATTTTPEARDQIKTLETALQASEHNVATAQAEAQNFAARIGELERELGRIRHDKGSYEVQIKDLLDEVSELRRGDEMAQQEMQHLRDATTTAQNAVLSLQAQLDVSTNDMHRLTHAVAPAGHQGRISPTPAMAPPIDAASVAVPAAGPRDAIGRRMEASVEELEDLLSDLPPPVSPRR